MAGEPRCWSWDGLPDPVDTDSLLPASRDLEGTAWCSGLGNELDNPDDVHEVEGDFVSVSAGCRWLLLDAAGAITDVPFLACGGVESGFLCDIRGGPFTAVASYDQESCALRVDGGIECSQEDDRGCVTGTPADLNYWD